MYSICINWISCSKSAPAVPLTGPEVEASAGQISISFCVVRSMQALCIIYISLIFGFGVCICDTFKKSDVGYAEPALLPAKQQISLLLIPLCVEAGTCIVWAIFACYLTSRVTSSFQEDNYQPAINFACMCDGLLERVTKGRQVYVTAKEKNFWNVTFSCLCVCTHIQAKNLSGIVAIPWSGLSQRTAAQLLDKIWR